MAIKSKFNIIECLSTDGRLNVPDGWYMKHTDTGNTFYRYDNAWNALGIGFSYAPPTKSGVVTTDDNGLASIDFNTEFIDDDYTIALSCQVKGNREPLANWVTKDNHGFTIRSSNPVNGNALGGVVVSWLCTRNFND